LCVQDAKILFFTLKIASLRLAHSKFTLPSGKSGRQKYFHQPAAPCLAICRDTETDLGTWPLRFFTLADASAKNLSGKHI
jgi:hypothetical protein